MKDDDFTPRLGPIGDRAAGSPGAYLSRLSKMVGVDQGSGKPAAWRRAPIKGSRFRGHAVAKVLIGRGDQSARLSRPVVVKFSIQRFNSPGLGALRSHLAYLQRDGVGRQGEPGRFYGPEGLEASAKAFVERSQDDRHQFRFVLSPLHGDEFSALEALSRVQFSADVEGDLSSVGDPSTPRRNVLVGRVIEAMPPRSGEPGHVLLDGVDGKLWYVETGLGRIDLEAGAIASLTRRSVEPGPDDHMAMRIARQFRGQYSRSLHYLFDPSVSPAVIARVEARVALLAMQPGGLGQVGPNSFELGEGHLQFARDYERRLAAQSPVVFRILSRLSLAAQRDVEAATWLDRYLVGEGQMSLADHGFGAVVKEAADHRIQWLVSQGLAQRSQEGLQLKSNLVEILKHREIRRYAQTYSQSSGLSFVPPSPGLRVKGRIALLPDMISAPMVQIESRTEFGVAPWRQSHVPYLGRQVVGVYRGANQDLVVTQGPDLER